MIRRVLANCGGESARSQINHKIDKIDKRDTDENSGTKIVKRIKTQKQKQPHRKLGKMGFHLSSAIKETKYEKYAPRSAYPRARCTTAAVISFISDESLDFASERNSSQGIPGIEKSRTGFVPATLVPGLNRLIGRGSRALVGLYTLSLPFSFTGCWLSIRFLAMNRGMMPSASRWIEPADTVRSPMIIRPARCCGQVHERRSEIDTLGGTSHLGTNFRTCSGRSFRRY